MEKYKLVNLLVSVRNEIENQQSEIVEDLQSLIDDIEFGSFKIEEVKIDYKELANSMIESCLDMAIEDNQNFSQSYLDCHINPELVSFVDVQILIDEIKNDNRVENCDNIYSDCYEIYFKEKFLKTI